MVKDRLKSAPHWQEISLALGFDIIFQDQYLLVIDKPVGLLSVPGRLPENFDSVALRLQQQFDPQARIVHRLDCDTSGLMVLARNADTHRELSRQFHDREVDKEYLALVWGDLAGEEGKVDLPLRYDPPNKPRHIVDHVLGKSSLTFWRVLSRESQWTRVSLTPYTGRSHQLRVHMLSLGHPIVGDPLYATGEARVAMTRLCLHAAFLAFTHPETQERMEFSLPSPF